MKKMMLIAGAAAFAVIGFTGCSTGRKHGGVPPIYYDYGYNFDEKSETNHYHNYNRIYNRKSTEHKHEYIKFDYRED